jgi:protein ImuB
MQWVALSPSPPSSPTPPSSDALTGLATWALQFTPRVAYADEAVVLELGASLRLFGGRRALHERLREEAPELGCTAIAWAPNSLAALACARAGIVNGLRLPLAQLLDALPLDTLSATGPHRVTLAQLGCRTLGDVRRLPRGGLSRRFGKELLGAFDMAYGLRPEVHAWAQIPETFRARLELMSRVDTAPALLFGARRLLMQLCGWLAARHAGISTFTLHWAHDAMRSRDTDDGGELTVRTAQPMRNLEHLCRLLAEHLAHVELQAPVGDLVLSANEVLPSWRSALRCCRTARTMASRWRWCLNALLPGWALSMCCARSWPRTTASNGPSIGGPRPCPCPGSGSCHPRCRSRASSCLSPCAYWCATIGRCTRAR